MCSDMIFENRKNELEYWTESQNQPNAQILFFKFRFLEIPKLISKSKRKRTDAAIATEDINTCQNLNRSGMWILDSYYDGREYESDPEDRQFFADEDDYQEYRIRKRRAFESKGFHPEPLSGIYPIQDLEDIAYRNMTARELMTNLANLCVKKLNKEKVLFVSPTTMPTMKSSDVTAKRASATDSLAVGEDKIDFSPMKKHKVDEEDDGNIESESESSDGSMTLGDYKGIQDYSEPEPEWDVDSFDGREYESDPELRERFGDENAYMEYREERIKALENRGFLPDPFNFIGTIGNLDGPVNYNNMTNREHLADLASLCVKKLNEDKGKTVELVSIVRSTMSGGAKSKLYITFMAREYPNGPLVEYQAKVMIFAGEHRPPFPILCRPAPKPLI